MRTKRRASHKWKVGRHIVLELHPVAWECLDHIADRSDCSVAEVIELALNDWAEGSAKAIEVLGEDTLIGIGSFTVKPEAE